MRTTLSLILEGQNQVSFKLLYSGVFLGGHFKGWLLIFSTESKYFAAFERSRDFSEWLPNGLMLSSSSEINPFLRSLRISHKAPDFQPEDAFQACQLNASKSLCPGV